MARKKMSRAQVRTAIKAGRRISPAELQRFRKSMVARQTMGGERGFLARIARENAVTRARYYRNKAAKARGRNERAGYLKLAAMNAKLGRIVTKQKGGSRAAGG